MEFSLDNTTTTPPRQTSSAALETYLAGPSRWSSTDLYGGPLIVRSRVEPAVNDYLFIPATPDPWLVVMTGGKRHVEVRDGRRWRGAHSGPGQVAVTSPGTVTEIRWRGEGDAPIETLHICLDAGLFHRVASDVSRCDPGGIEVLDILSEKDPFIEQIGTALTRELTAPSMCGHLFADAAAQLLSAYVLQHYCVFPSAPPSSAPALSRRKVRQVQDYVEANMAAAIALDELAEVVGINVYHFARMFKRATGETPHSFVRRRKLGHAKRLLAETEWEVSKVARAVGYLSSSHFAAVFQREAGVTPSVYRSLCH
jgi:AraC family transcriptional regulator